MKRVKSYHIVLDYNLWKQARIEAIKADKSMPSFVSEIIKEKVKQLQSEIKNQAGEKK